MRHERRGLVPFLFLCEILEVVATLLLLSELRGTTPYSILVRQHEQETNDLQSRSFIAPRLVLLMPNTLRDRDAPGQAAVMLVTWR
jgi:hypothetical protein